MAPKDRNHHRLERTRALSESILDRGQRTNTKLKSNTVVDCGWGRLLFAQTFKDLRQLARCLSEERAGKRDIAIYVGDPHVILSLAPQALFLDPSHTFRLWLERYQDSPLRPRGFLVRVLNRWADATAICRFYAVRKLISPRPEFIWAQRTSKVLQYWVAADKQDGTILGTITGIDHVEAFDDNKGGSSFWALAVDAQAPYPGIGEALVRRAAEFYRTRGRAFLDLSVIHDNEQAIRLYEKLGFERVPVFALKNKNAYNESLFTAQQPEGALNPYATIIVAEARRRGIGIEILDPEGGYFALSFGGRRIVCRESLSELTTAIAMSRCDDKVVTWHLLRRAGLQVPDQCRCETLDQAEAFLSKHHRIVVKPARGEQGAGVSVDIREPEELIRAIEVARRSCETVILEEFRIGQDLRIIVIDFEVVAAAIRRPAQIMGTGRDSIAELIRTRSRRRRAATGGESSIPLDEETERCVRSGGYGMDDVLAEGEVLVVRKTANLHTGGTIHDVTSELDPVLAEAARMAARTLDIPVTGLDFLVPDTASSDYVIIEANERPGLANHEPQPTAERFIDLLFPQTASLETFA